MTWTAPDKRRGSPITGYAVTAVDTTTPGNGGQTCAGTDPATGCTVTGLTTDDTFVVVTATNELGCTSDPSDESSPVMIA